MGFTSAEVAEFLGPPKLSSDSFSGTKPVASRRNRPTWAANDHSLMAHLMDARFLRRLRIAYLYWRDNYSAKQIAARLAMKVRTVEDIIYKMVRE